MVWPLTSEFTPLSLCFLVCEMGVNMHLSGLFCWGGIKWTIYENCLCSDCHLVITQFMLLFLLLLIITLMLWHSVSRIWLPGFALFRDYVTWGDAVITPIDLRICRNFQVDMPHLPVPQGLARLSLFASLNQTAGKYGERNGLDYLWFQKPGVLGLIVLWI